MCWVIHPVTTHVNKVTVGKFDLLQSWHISVNYAAVMSVVFASQYSYTVSGILHAYMRDTLRTYGLGCIVVRARIFFINISGIREQSKL